jgi:hypothetical protein
VHALAAAGPEVRVAADEPGLGPLGRVVGVAGDLVVGEALHPAVEQPARHAVAGLEDDRARAGLGELGAQDRAREAGADDADVVGLRGVERAQVRRRLATEEP